MIPVNKELVIPILTAFSMTPDDEIDYKERNRRVALLLRLTPSQLRQKTKEDNSKSDFEGNISYVSSILAKPEAGLLASRDVPAQKGYNWRITPLGFDLRTQDRDKEIFAIYDKAHAGVNS
jgi:hypothetical protein